MVFRLKLYESGGKNYEFVVISKDKGFDAIGIDFLIYNAMKSILMA